MTGTRTFRILRLVLLAVLAGVVTDAAGRVPESISTDSASAASADAVDAALLTAADDALRIFADAGLELPEGLAIEFDTSLETCAGTGGRYRRGATPRIVMCGTTVTTPLRRTLLHELAHAWEDLTMDDAHRDAYMHAKALPTWRSHDHPWGDRAGEHVAEVIAWGVMDGPGRLVSVPHDGCAALAAEYEALTGTPPPAGLAAGCTASVDHNPSGEGSGPVR